MKNFLNYLKDLKIRNAGFCKGKVKTPLYLLLLKMH